MSESVTIRMYNVGFGDSFLIRFPAEDRPRKVLIDCGSHSSGPGPRKMTEIVQRIVADCADGEPDGRPRIDVVVGTHRHRDHVSGFDRAEWADVEVAEVWLPWTEHPTDTEAKRIRETQSRTARRLHLAFDRRLTGLMQAGVPEEEIVRLNELKTLVDNSLTNAEAMATLHHGFAGRPLRRFFPEKTDGGPTIAAATLPGVTVHLLGPSRDPGIIREMNPPIGESFLRLLDDEPEAEPLRSPFAGGWWADTAAFAPGGPYAHLAVGAKDRHAISTLDDGSGLAAAVALEKAVNGTSLMLMFEFGKAFLLFPGDAQWGTWQAAIEDPRRRLLLEKTTFLKIGHHGSHNATPVTFVEDVLGDNVRAMVSTRPISFWPHIPRGPLLEALAAKCGTVVRSDVIDAALPDGFTRHEDLFTEVQVPS